MSLFPAYEQQPGSSASNSAEKDTSWLNNASYDFLPTTVPGEHPTAKEPREIKKKKRKIKRKEKTKEKVNNPPDDNNDINFEVALNNENFCVDANRQIGYLTVNTLIRPAVPRYTRRFIKNISPYLNKLGKKKKIVRYFRIRNKEVGNDNIGSLSSEVEATKKVEQFNKSLTNNPKDVDLWIEFVSYQDDFFRFQHIQHKSVAERERATLNQKLAILERAIASNHSSEALQTMWLDIAGNILTSQEASVRAKKLVADYGSNMTLLLGQIALVQHSLARCSASVVTTEYESALDVAYKGFPGEHNDDVNEHVLEMLLHVCKFQDQCGRWEALLTILKLYLDLNFDQSWYWPAGAADSVVAQAEDAVITEDAPLWHMWLRIETLREAAHYAPVFDSVDYPLRVMLTREVAPLVHHLHRRHHFRLLAVTLACVRVPFLPLTSSLVRHLLPHCLPWVLDGVENVLAGVLAPPVLSLTFGYFKNISSLTAGPGYLKRCLGQAEFLQLVSEVFYRVLELVTDRQRSAVAVWWLRFQRYLHKLQANGLASLPEGTKPVRQVFKEFLKLEQNRDNALLYLELSLMEFELGNTATAIKTTKTVISSKPAVLSIYDQFEQGIVCALYRLLIELHVANQDHPAAVSILLQLTGTSQRQAAEAKLSHVALEMVHSLDTDSNVELEELMLPVLVVEWIGCYLWYLALDKTPAAALEYLKSVMDTWQQRKGIRLEHIRESLWEIAATVTWKLDRENQSQITWVLGHAHALYPHNLTFLAMMANKELEGRGMWWSMSNAFLIPPTPMGAVYLACTGLERFHSSQEDMKPSLSNRVRLLLQRLARKEGKYSSVCHRLYLRFLRTWHDGHLEAAQLHAMESCPWNKSIYMEGIGLAPGQLLLLTDVMVEKELRIHLTPDELQEMRN